MSFTRFWYEVLPFNVFYCIDELPEHSQRSSCLRDFSCCIRVGLYFFFLAKYRGCWEENSRVSVLCFPYTVSAVVVICLGFSAVVRDSCSVSQLRRGDRAGAACEGHPLKALAPNFTCADAGKHSLTVLWSTRQRLCLAVSFHAMSLSTWNNFNPHCSQWYVRTFGQMC